MLHDNKEWYKIKNIDEVDSPALLVYPERVKANIDTLIKMVDGDVARLRPHAKTHKTIEATSLLLQAGITKFKCATIAEAELLATAGAPDVLLAYQPQGPKITRFISLIKKFSATRFSCLVDNSTSAKNIAEAASSHNLDIPVYLDINVGMSRTGIEPGEEAIQLYIECEALKGVTPVGIQVYDGHIRDTDFDQRKIKSDEAFAPAERMVLKLKERGFDPVIVAGGSPTFSVHAKRTVVECSPGTFIFWDKNYLQYEDQAFMPAALVLTRVVSLPETNKVCFDLGHKSIASENELHNRVFFPAAPELKFVGHSEEHLVAEVPEGHALKVGDVLYGIPYHVCPTCALYERALTVEDATVNGEWKIVARDRKITI